MRPRTKAEDPSPTGPRLDAAKFLQEPPSPIAEPRGGEGETGARTAVASLRPWDDYREYLRLLVQVQLSPRLQVKLDASDVVQQAILQAPAKRAQFRGQTEAEWLGWRRAILANTLAAEGRRYAAARDVSRERSLAAEFDLSSSRLECLLVADQTSPSQRAVRTEELLRLAQALAQLPEDQRHIVRASPTRCG